MSRCRTRFHFMLPCVTVYTTPPVMPFVGFWGFVTKGEVCRGDVVYRPFPPVTIAGCCLGYQTIHHPARYTVRGVLALGDDTSDYKLRELLPCCRPAFRS